MIRAIYATNGTATTERDIEKIPEIMAAKPRLMWLDITIDANGFSGEEIALLSETFKFHDLSIEDCLFPQYHPKVEEFENYIFAAVHGIRLKAKDLSDFEESIYELDLFISRDYVVTVHTGDLMFIEALFERARLMPQIELKSMEALLYHILQKVVGNFEQALDKIGDRIDDIEDRVITEPTAELMSEILWLKKILLNLRKVTEPQVGVYNFFTRESTGIIARKSAVYFRDIFFQLDRINQSISSHNQMMGSILEIYVSGVTLKLNEVMKFLTIIATVLLPAVLIVSYYGMNVNFPEHRLFGIDNVWYFAMFVMAASTLAVYIYIKKKKWF